MRNIIIIIIIIIITTQAVSNAFNIIFHITESDIIKANGTIITPFLYKGKLKTIFIGYVNCYTLFLQCHTNLVQTKAS